MGRKFGAVAAAARICLASVGLIHEHIHLPVIDDGLVLTAVVE